MEQLIRTNDILNGGKIETYKIEGLFYVKSIIGSFVKFSEAVYKSEAEYLEWDAINYGNLNF